MGTDLIVKSFECSDVISQNELHSELGQMIKNQELIKDYIKYYEEYHEWNNFNPDDVNNIFENVQDSLCDNTDTSSDKETSSDEEIQIQGNTKRTKATKTTGKNGLTI